MHLFRLRHYRRGGAPALPGHFLQGDLNATPDLSFFAGQSIDVIHVGGLLEYLNEPAPLLTEARRLVSREARLLVSMINFDGRHYGDGRRHHPGWVYTPHLDEFLRVLRSTGWQDERIWPIAGRSGPTFTWFRLAAARLGYQHPWARRWARQFVVLARAG